jgi:hypothetical protein
MANREDITQSAIADLNAGVYTSQRAACKAYSIPRSTLRHRMAGSLPHATAHQQQQQRLTLEQEEFLVDTKLQYQLDRTTIKKPKKRIAIDLNERFKNLEAIKTAIEEAYAQEAQKASKSSIKAAKKPSDHSADPAVDSMYIQWQL